MEKIITNNPGLQHLAEKVFWNLDVKDLKICAKVNQSCKQILQKPMFCLRKFGHLSKENRKDWIKNIQSLKTSDEGIVIISYMQWILKKENLEDFPCYSSPAVQDEFRERIREICRKKGRSSPKDIEVVNILAPLTDNPNNPDKIGETPIYMAATRGHEEIVKILAPLTKNPNALNRWAFGYTPIHVAARWGHTEIVTTLAAFTDDPNAPDALGRTPIYMAADEGHIEIVKILAPWSSNPNAPCDQGLTPSAISNNEEIQRFLESFYITKKYKAEPMNHQHNRPIQEI